MNSRLMETILDTMWRGSGYGASMAMAMIYFGAVTAVLAVAFALVSRRVFYRT